MIYDTFTQCVVNGKTPDLILHKLLDDSERGQHQITIRQRDAEYPDIVWEYNVAAYHVDFVDWIAIKTTAVRFMKEGFNEEGERFIFPAFVEDPSEVPLPKCRTPDWLSTETTVVDNCIDDNADVNGTMAQSRAQRNYYFWLEDLKKYAVLRMSYFVF